jgi:hypothetical protein
MRYLIWLLLTISTTSFAQQVDRIVTETTSSNGGTITLGLIEVLQSGVYTPSLTTIVNMDSATPSEFQYLRVGTTVTVSGKVTVDATTAGVLAQFRFTLPISSTFSCDCQLAGVGAIKRATNQGTATILGDSANNAAAVDYGPTTTGSEVMYVHFTYQIVSE